MKDARKKIYYYKFDIFDDNREEAEKIYIYAFFPTFFSFAVIFLVRSKNISRQFFELNTLL